MLPSQPINKSEAASRQLIEAIRLFFDDRDPVAIHTLVAAAHQVLTDLGKHGNVSSVVKRSTEPDRELLSAVNYPFNFFKHADRDSNNQIDVGPLHRFTQDFIMDGVLMLQGIAGEIPFEAKVFWTWFVSKYPEEFDNLPLDGEIAKLQSLEMAKMPFNEIFAFLSFNRVMVNGRGHR